jgi:hypothetical protein
MGAGHYGPQAFARPKALRAGDTRLTDGRPTAVIAQKDNS